MTTAKLLKIKNVKYIMVLLLNKNYDESKLNFNVKNIQSFWNTHFIYSLFLLNLHKK